MKVAFVIAALTLSSATPGLALTPETDQRVCITTVRFSAESGRSTFIEQNASALVQLPASLIIVSPPNDPALLVFTTAWVNTCPAPNVSSLARLAERTELHVSSATIALSDAVERVGPLLGVNSISDVHTIRRCVGRVANPGDSDDTFFEMMASFSRRGLREGMAQVTNDGLFFSADESCESLGAIARAALTHVGASATDLSLCPQASYRACGDTSEWSIGPVPEQN